jgi:hypothetical protein
MNMGIKFNQIYDSILESVTTRNSAGGGYLPGDIVEFRSDYKKNVTYKAMPSNMRDEVDQMTKCGLNIRVVQVGDRLSGVSAGNQHKKADDVVVTLACDQGGGRYYSTVTVGTDMIEPVTMNDPSPTIPDKFYRDDSKYMSGKAEEYVSDMKNITRLTDKGNGKNTPTNLRLAGESTMLTKDNNKLGDILEEMYSPTDYYPIYQKVLIEEGMLRRLATKFAGGFKSNPLQKQGQNHQFAQSAALDIGKDISKSFGGDYNQHAQALYKYILDYISQVVK